VNGCFSTAPLAALLLGCLLPIAAAAAPTPVRLLHKGDSWTLERGGQPYFVKGAGGSMHLEELVARGGNSIRTWGASDLDTLLDKAHALGLSVTVGFWLGHERHGFNYQDNDSVTRQFEDARKAVLKYKDHPAVLMWAVGNEMEGNLGSNPAIWYAANHIARMCKELDPNHPTMTVVAELGGKKVANLHRFCPDIDIVGINTYGGIGSIGTRYAAAGGTKPYMVTEFGPPGTWEMGKEAWGAPNEFNSTAKAEWYLNGYRDGILGHPDTCLGSYVFVWGSKQEATATWYGLFLKDGARLGAVEAMTTAWGGKQYANRCPTISNVTLDRKSKLKPGEEIHATVTLADPDDDPLTVKWVLRADSGMYGGGGDAQPDQPAFPQCITAGDASGATVEVPTSGGAYRLFCYAYDGNGNAAVANAPFHVDAPEVAGPAPRATVPAVVFAETLNDAAWVPSGYMGKTDAVKMSPHGEQPFEGKVCLKVSYTAADNWGGVVWQSPPNDWGDKAGGFDLSAANVLVFAARGGSGGEVVSFGVGTIGPPKLYYDTARESLKNVTLTRDWQEYRIPLGGKNLARIKSGFLWTLAGQGKPLTFFLDHIRFIHDPALPDAVSELPSAGASAAFPFAVYADGMGEPPWAPSGYMGNAAAIKQELASTTSPHSGATCLEVTYSAADNWGGVVWQSPADDWGEKPGGYDLAGADTLEFWARGAAGGERVTFGFGLLDGKATYFDTAKGELKTAQLTTEWQRFSLPLAGKDLTRIKTGFYWSLGGQGKPLTFFLDDIRYVQAPTD
jgi:hypothetical protein